MKKEKNYISVAGYLDKSLNVHPYIRTCINKTRETYYACN